MFPSYLTERFKRMQVIGNLQQLTFLDASKNYIESVADEIERCLSLTDLYLSNNRLQQLPESIGNCLLLCTVRNEWMHWTWQLNAVQQP